MAKRWTNAQVGEIMTKVEVALQAPPGGFSQEDHDALITLVTKMEFVEGAAKEWKENHTVVANLKQRQTLIMGVGGTVTLGVVAEVIRRLVNHFFA